MIPALLTTSLLASTAIIHVDVEVGDGTTLENATVVFDGDRIVSVGKGPPPAGAAVIDGTGKVLTPGLVESVSRLGLAEVQQEGPTRDDVSGQGPVEPAFRAADAYNPLSPRVAINRAGGVTSAVVAPGGTLLYGTAAWVELRDELDAAPEPAHPVGMAGGVGGARSGAPFATRGEMWLELRTVMHDARFYLANRAAFDRGSVRPLALPPMHLAALEPVLRGDIPLVLHVHRAADILTALRFAREEKLRLILAGATEAWLAAEQIAAAQVPVILKPSDSLPANFDRLAARDDAAALLHEAGVQVVISSSDRDINLRRLRQEAGIAVAHGLPRFAALAAITSVPASLFGQSNVGLVAPNKRANLVLWSGDPLELTTVAQRVWIAGEEQSLQNRQRSLAERYLRRLGLVERAQDSTSP